MSYAPSDRATTARNASPRLPAELYYPICANVSSRHDLLTLASTSRILQRPSESTLQRNITLNSKDRGWRFVSVMKDCPRFAPLVHELQLEMCTETSGVQDSEYCSDIRDALGQLVSLEKLIIDDGANAPLSWILSTLPKNRLRVLRCAFVLDTGLLYTLQQQNTLEDLSWSGDLISIPSAMATESPCPSVQSDNTSRPDSDHSIISFVRQHLPPTSLPRLKYLHSESLALARALVPGRDVTHLWVRGVSFAATVSKHYVYRHITRPPDHEHSSSESHSTASGSEQTRPALLVDSLTDCTNMERSEYLCRAIHDFSLSKGPVLSFRLALDLPHDELVKILVCISQNLPSLKALGFLPASIFDFAGKQSGLKSVQKTFEFLIPPFEHLHSICLWSTPSRRAVSILEKNYDLPALRTLACLHFSPTFEWLCLPINNYDTDESNWHYGGIKWKRDVDFNMRGEKIDGDRLSTAVHDPENLLWRDV